MSERYIVIRNWDKFQHKDIWRKSGGSPPWIKNYTALLHDDEYMGLSWAQRGILHGLWLMYASSGRAVNENRSRTLLSRNKGESRHFLGHLEALSSAGFIEFVAQPIRAPSAPRVEERREEEHSKDESSASGETAERETLRGNGQPTEAEIVAAREKREQSGWVEDLGSYTGCRIVRGEIGISHVYDPLGTEFPPDAWPHPRPTALEVRRALKERSVA